MAAKSTKLEVSRRVEAVTRMLLRGWREPNIVQNVSQTWGVTERQVWHYIRKARQGITTAAKARMANALEQHLGDREELRREASEAGDHALVLAILKDEGRLLNLYPPARLDVRVSELDAAIAAELAKLATAAQSSPLGETEDTDGGGAGG